MKPVDTSDLDMAFGGDMKKILPPMEEIPEEFKHSSGKWNIIFSQWFFIGISEGTEFFPKEDVDGDKAVRHVVSIMRSFEPKHEHKEAGCAYLLSQWVDDIKMMKV